MYHSDECDVDDVHRDVRGMNVSVHIDQAQDSEWDGSELCQYMSLQIWKAYIRQVWGKAQHCRRFLCHREMDVKEQIDRRKTYIKLSRDINHLVGYPEC